MMTRPQNQEEGASHRKSKRPSDRAVLLVLCVLLAAALIVIYRFSSFLTNQSLQTLKEEKEVLRGNLSDKICLKKRTGWELHGDQCYHFSRNKSSWNDSRRSCEDLGGDLVKVDSREEQMLLERRLGRLMKDFKDVFWIGLTDSEEEGSWFWVDGSPLNQSLSFWRNNEPNNSSGGAPGDPGEDCVTAGKKGGADLNSWNDISCQNVYRMICEKSAETGRSSCPCV